MSYLSTWLCYYKVERTSYSFGIFFSLFFLFLFFRFLFFLRVYVSDQASVIILENSTTTSEKEKEEEMKEREKEGRERKPIAFSRYHHCRPFALSCVDKFTQFFLFFFDSQYTSHRKCSNDFFSRIFYKNSFELVKRSWVKRNAE